MAKAGNYAAYQQSQPIAEDFGNNMLQAEDQQFKYRQEKRIEEERQYQKQKDQDEAYLKDINSQKAVITGIESVDQINYRMYTQAVDRIGGIHKRLAEGNLSPEERQQLMHQRGMLNKLPEFIDNATKRLSTFAQKVSEGIANGTVSKAAMQDLEDMEAFFGTKGPDGRITPNYIVDLDKNGLPVAKVMGKDGKIKEVSFVDVVNGAKYNTEAIPQVVQSDDFVKKQVELLGKRQVPTGQNGMVGVAQTFEPHRKYVDNALGELLGTAEDPTPMALSIWADAPNMNRDLEDFGPEAMKQVRQHLLERIESGYDQTFSGSQKNEPRSNDYRPSAGERARIELGNSLYQNVHLAAQGDTNALGSLQGRSKKIGTYADGSAKYVTAEEVFIADGQIVIADSEGQPIEKIPMDAHEDAKASRLLAWFSDGDPTEMRNLYNIGKSQLGGVAPRTESRAKQMKETKVPAIEVDEAFENMKFSTNGDAVRDALRNSFPEESTGFSFSSYGMGVHEIEVTAPNGQRLELELAKNDLGKVKEKIKEFMKNNQTKTKFKYVPAEEGETSNTAEPVQGSIEELPDIE